MKTCNVSIAALFAALPFVAQADQVFNDEVIVTGNLLCVGFDCADGEDPIFDASGSRTGVRISAINTSIEFADTSDPNGSFPYTVWRLDANESSDFGQSGFFLSDLTNVTTPFKVLASARENALYVGENGRVGFGTSLPVSDLHIVSSSSGASLRLEETSGIGQAHSLSTDSVFGLSTFDATAGTFPFYIRNGAPNSSIDVTSSGDIGVGTNSPDGKLHTFGSGVQLAYFESGDGGPVQVRFRTDSENRRFLAVNNANEVKTQIVFGDNEILFLGETVAQEWLRISGAGIVSSGPTCSPDPCDATFNPEAFALPPIEERAALMWENKHLPAVGATEPGAPFNLTEKMGGVIHELEVAHIYIEQLHDEIATLHSDHSAALATQAAELEELRTLITAD